MIGFVLSSSWDICNIGFVIWRLQRQSAIAQKTKASTIFFFFAAALFINFFHSKYLFQKIPSVVLMTQLLPIIKLEFSQLL